MMRLILAAAIMVSAYVISQAQQLDQPRVVISPPFVMPTQLENKYLVYSARRPVTRPGVLPMASQRSTHEPDLSQDQFILAPGFVWVNGALYTRLPGDGTLIPVPGGGASGCFAGLELTSRTFRMKTFDVKLEKLLSH